MNELEFLKEATHLPRDIEGRESYLYKGELYKRSTDRAIYLVDKDGTLSTKLKLKDYNDTRRV